METTAPVQVSPFYSGQVFTYLYPFVTNHLGDRDGQLLGTRVGLSYYFRDHLAVALEGVGVVSRVNEDRGGAGHSAGGGVDTLLRWHFWTNDRLSFFADGGVGLLYLGRSMPSGGTHLNFTLQAGLGGTLRLSERVHLLGGTRWYHLSNGSFYGAKNPAYDGIQGYLGLQVAY